MEQLNPPSAEGQPQNASGPPSIARFPPSAQIQARVIFEEVTYFALTQEQVDTYTSLSWLTTVFLTLAGMSFEAVFASWIALTQGGLSLISELTLSTVMWAAGIAGLVLLASFVIFSCLKCRNKRGWLTNTVQLEQET